MSIIIQICIHLLEHVQANDFYVKNYPTKPQHFQCVFNNDINANLIKDLHEHVYKALHRFRTQLQFSSSICHVYQWIYASFHAKRIRFD
ncbi:hypothetical protein H5410_041604 [Solanum commersonii]|uniref:Uncharacterized protein n=1 Tax=Solanum commersonii TaxID=4109 RepID=A0A9J5XTK4_SOLCO|nr:hypothetical protein H5410_041604 [Solanum commersonii]